jgi:hypothetical protein
MSYKEKFSHKHEIRLEDRLATCCDEHRDRWAVCSCGWEYNSRGSQHVESAIAGHRLKQIEMALNITVTFK